MGLTWQPWTTVAQGGSMPGAPLAAVPWGDSYALFLVNPRGYVFGIKTVEGYGWEQVPGLTTMPGGHVTAVASGSHFKLFVADVNGEVFTTSGAPYQGWANWTNVSEGGTLPGAPIAAVPWGNSFALFLANPNGRIYGTNAVQGSGWDLVPGLDTAPGGHITAVASGNRFTLFMSDSNGEVWMNTGLPYQGWDGWVSMSQGSTPPGSPVSAVPWEDSFALFLADPSGGVYTSKAGQASGWRYVPGRTTTPGAYVTAMPAYQPPSDIPRFRLFMTDINGSVCTTSGIPYQTWDPWTDLSEQSAPGGQITAEALGYGFVLFNSDNNGEIFKALPSSPPATPLNLMVTSVTSQSISVSWTETNPPSVELDGFSLYLKRLTGPLETFITNHGPIDRSATYTSLTDGVEYELLISAYNANGYSSNSAPATATTPLATDTVTLTLTPQGANNVGQFVPYVGAFPAFGFVSPGHVIKITLPPAYPILAFVKVGHSTEDCGNPSAVVALLAGQSTTPAQMTAIFGVTRPPFTTQAPFYVVACWSGGNLPNWISIELTVVYDG